MTCAWFIVSALTHIFAGSWSIAQGAWSVLASAGTDRMTQGLPPMAGVSDLPADWSRLIHMSWKFPEKRMGTCNTF